METMVPSSLTRIRLDGKDGCTSIVVKIFEPRSAIQSSKRYVWQVFSTLVVVEIRWRASDR